MSNEVGDCLAEAVRLVNRFGVPRLAQALMRGASVELDDDILINERVFRRAAGECAEIIGRHPHGDLATIVYWDAGGRGKGEMLEVLWEARNKFDPHTILTLTKGDGE